MSAPIIDITVRVQDAGDEFHIWLENEAHDDYPWKYPDSDGEAWRIVKAIVNLAAKKMRGEKWPTTP